MINKAQWSTNFSNIKFENTTKQYFNKYCFKLVLFAPGGRAIYNKSISIGESIEIRQRIGKSYNYGGSWSRSAVGRYLNLANVALLEYIKNKKTELKDIVQFRVEEPFVTVYADSEEELFKFAVTLPKNCAEKIELLSGPASQSALALLKTGAILTSKPSDYQFKVTLRDGRFPLATKQSLLNYLTGLGDEVYLPKGCRSQLTKTIGWVYGIYFYCADDKIITMINLIEPNFVRGINSLVHHNDH